MNRFSIYLTLALILSAFGGGMWLGLYMNSPIPVEPLSVEALQSLRAKMVELNAREPIVITKWKEAKRAIPKDLAKEVVEIAEAAGFKEPTEAIIFDLKPEAHMERGESVECAPPCVPQDLQVRGWAEKIADVWAWKGTLIYDPLRWEGWEADLKGTFVVLDPPPPPRMKRWFAGPTISVRYNDSSYRYGAVVGRTWRHFVALGEVESDRVMVGVGVRFGR